MTLDQARKRFLYTHAEKDWFEKKCQGPCMAILRSLKLPRTIKAARHPFFEAIIHPNFKRTKNRRRTWGRYMQPRGIFYGERFLSRKKLTALWFPPASKGRKLHGNSGWEFSCCVFSNKGEERILQKQVECFDMNRANKWVQASQSLTGSQRGQSSARCSIYGNIAHNEALPDERPISPRLCPTAKRYLCHARLNEIVYFVR